MSRANPFDFVRTLRSLNVELTAAEQGEDSLATRPRRLFKRLERLGYGVELTKPNARQLGSYGFAPTTVIDIGVHNGTAFLYQGFPDANFLLIDPLAECEERVKRWDGRIRYEFKCCALGPRAGKMELNIPHTESKAAVARASLREFTPAYNKSFAGMEKREVPVKTLDSVAKGFDGPFGIKIDTEGYELEVIKGAKKTLKDTEFVIAEVSVRERFAGGYRFSELIAEMGKNGFEPLDFLTPLRPGTTDCDILFARYESPHFSMDE
jgi:FkbM family methyltransferase